MAFSRLRSKAYGYYQRKAASLVFKRSFAIDTQQPLISFTFDDFPQSAFKTGGAILNQFGVVGTYYVALGLHGKTEPSGSMFARSDLPALASQGHELGCHTYAHCNSWETDSNAFENSIIVNRAALKAIVPGAEFKNFSYPISLPKPLTKAKIADYFLSCRGGGQTINSGRADLNQLAAYFLEQSKHNFSLVQEIIDRNRHARGWLIFATHDIAENPSPFGCTPEFFERVVRYAVGSGARVVSVAQALERLNAPRCRSFSSVPADAGVATDGARTRALASSSKPLVSILIPAYNAQVWISQTLRSALAQTWEPKEIIVVDDGSTDRTLAIAREFESDLVRVVSQKNQGAAAARNAAISLSKGEYIQWLDADDLLAPDKISRQMEALPDAGKRVLLSSAWGKFTHRWYRAQFVPTALWRDQSRAEWLYRKIAENLYMQTSTWLVSRELTEAAGPWDVRLSGNDDDGEYFCRILLASDGVKFEPEAKVYYRVFGDESLSNIGTSDKKREALWLSMQLHIKYLRSLEDSPKTRAACVQYLQRNLFYFYPNRPDISKQAQQMASELGGRLGLPVLAWWYSGFRMMMGWSATKHLAMEVRGARKNVRTKIDKMWFLIDSGQDLWRFREMKGDFAAPKSLVHSK
jgi:glycosyltransferase involved in cell wall biosynthesis/peptidoglycan/xylan/chitin deacetylase (PgdA/CDA1 family)